MRGRARNPEDFWAVRDVIAADPQGQRLRAHRPQRLGQVDAAQDDRRHLPADGGHDRRPQGRVAALIELGAGFHPDMTGRENIALNGSILGLPRKEIADVTDEIIDFSGLGDFINDPVKHYSSGMYVRLGFSVAVHMKPDVLLVDEVLAVGDEEFQRKCFDHLYALRRSGRTIIVVSHGLGQLEGLCDEIAWLEHGVMQEHGPAVDTIAAYLRKVNADESARNPMVAAVRGEDDDSVRAGDQTVRVTHGARSSTSTGNPISHAETGTTFAVRVGITAPEEIARARTSASPCSTTPGTLVTMLSNHRWGVDFGDDPGRPRRRHGPHRQPAAARAVPRAHRRVRLHRLAPARLLERRGRVRRAQPARRDRAGPGRAARRDHVRLSVMVSESNPLIRAKRRAGRVKRWIKRKVYERNIGKQYKAWLAEAAQVAPGTTTHDTTISIIVPVYNPPVAFLRECLESVVAQQARNWQLVVADDGSTKPEVADVPGGVRPAARRAMPRIVVVTKENGGISSALNAALERATGRLRRHARPRRPPRPALHRRLLPGAGGERLPGLPSTRTRTRSTPRGEHFELYCKPDFSPELLLTQMYLCHFTVFRTEAVKAVGGLRTEMDGAQDFDLALRLLPAAAARRAPAAAATTTGGRGASRPR